MISKALSFRSIKGKLPKNPIGFAAFFRSMISRGLLLSDFKRFWWVSFLFSTVLIVVLPLFILLQGPPLPGEPWKMETLTRVLDFNMDRNALQMMLLLVVPVVLATMLFSYMQTARSAAKAHALPISRTTHFMTHCLAGIIMLTIPVLLTGTIMFFAIRASFLGQYITVGGILKWIYLYLVFTIFLFASAVFAGMFTGNSIAQIVFTYILNVLPAGLYAIIKYNLGRLLNGYPRNYSTASMARFLPVINLFSADRYSYMYSSQAGEMNNSFDSYTLVGYLAIAVALLAVSLFLYRRRRLEAAGDIISFRFARPVFKYGVTFCLMLLCGMYFAAISQKQSINMLIGCAIGSFVGYVVAEMLLQKSFRIFASYKGYIAFIAVTAVVYAAISLDAIGYSSRVPALSEVESVYFGRGAYDLQVVSKVESGNVELNTQEYYIKNFTFRSIELKRDIIELHNAMTNMKGSGLESQHPQYVLGYRLKDGSRLIREYRVDEKQIEELLKPIYETQEYKQGLFPITGKKSMEITDIRLREQFSGRTSVTLSDSVEIEDFTNVVKCQVEGYSYEDIKGGRILSTAEISYKNNRKDVFDYYSIRKKDELVIQWLKDKGYYEKVMLTPDKVDSITLEYQFRGGRRSNNVEITDKKLIEKLLDLEFDSEYNPNEEQVEVRFNTNRSSMGDRYPKKVLLDAGFGEYIKKLDQM